MSTQISEVQELPQFSAGESVDNKTAADQLEQASPHMGRVGGLLEQFEQCLTDLRNRPEELHYYSLEVGEGHSQGDVRIQYLGETWGDTANFLRLIRNVGESRPLDIETGDAHSHVVLEADSHEWYATMASNPLVGDIIKLAPDMQLHVSHNEHADVLFHQPGWYAVRFTRSPSVDERAASQALVRQVD